MRRFILALIHVLIYKKIFYVHNRNKWQVYYNQTHNIEFPFIFSFHSMSIFCMFKTNKEEIEIHFLEIDLAFEVFTLKHKYHKKSLCKQNIHSRFLRVYSDTNEQIIDHQFKANNVDTYTPMLPFNHCTNQNKIWLSNCEVSHSISTVNQLKTELFNFR